LKGSSNINNFQCLPQFIFEHSTGDIATRTFHKSLEKIDCPWKSKGRFEDSFNKKQKKNRDMTWPTDPNCKLVYKNLIPNILSRVNSSIEDYDQDGYIESYETDSTNTNRNRTTCIDLGHYHNQGRTIECLVNILVNPLPLFIYIGINMKLLTVF